MLAAVLRDEIAEPPKDPKYSRCVLCPVSPRIAALAVAATLTLAACGSDDPDPAAQESGLDDVSVSETADDATTPEVEFTRDR